MCTCKASESPFDPLQVPIANSVVPASAVANGNSSSSSSSGNSNSKVSVQKLDVGIYGWHKTMLYAAIILLTVLAVVNIGLLTYIIKACAITADGAGPVKFGVGSLTIDGDVRLSSSITDGIPPHPPPQK